METVKNEKHVKKTSREKGHNQIQDKNKAIDMRKLNPTTEYIDSQSGIGIGRQENFMVYQPEPTKKELRAQIRSLEKNLEQANITIEKLKQMQDESQLRLRKKMDQTLDEERYYNMVQLDKIKFELRKVREMIDSFARYSYAVIEANDMLDKRPCLFSIKRKMDKIFDILYTMEGKSPSEWVPPSIQYHIPERKSDKTKGMDNKDALLNSLETIYPKTVNDYVILGNKNKHCKNEMPDTRAVQKRKPNDKIFNPNDNGLDKEIEIKGIRQKHDSKKK